MEDLLKNTGSLIYVVGGLFVIWTIILWILLPFAIFGIKRILKDISDNLVRCGQLLIDIKKLLRHEIEEEQKPFKTD